MRSEAEWIRFLARRFRATRNVRVGIGDDAAVLAGDRRRDWVVTTDLLVAGVHFLPDTPPRAVGWKALTRSLSDIAAMGARPRYALVALALPPRTPAPWVEEFFAGVKTAARRYRVEVAGGDLSSAAQIVADVQVLGEVKRGRALLRRGAQPGDVIFVSGTLGLAAVGLAVLRRRLSLAKALRARVLRAHLFPEPRLALAQLLARRRTVTALIDISDGLSTDLGHLCEASRVGGRIFAARLPLVTLPPPLSARMGTSALELALHGGEDYELLFTLPSADAARLPKRLAGVNLTPIGEITRPPRMLLVDSDGRERPLPPRGWDHFRRQIG